jgi:hypothetical protein
MYAFPPSIIVNIDNPDAAHLQITRHETGVTLAYLDRKLCIVKAEHISFIDEPDLVNLVESTITGDVWNMNCLIALADKAEAPAVEPAPWKYVPWQPDTTPDFRNPSVAQAAS